MHVVASELTSTIIETYKRKPNIAILMSLAGSNARALLEDEEVRDLYRITTVVSDRPTSGAEKIAIDYGLTHLAHYDTKFSSDKERLRYFDHLAVRLGRVGVEACFYAGFMRVAAGGLLDRFPGVNAHPADLTDLDPSGIPKFRGMNAIETMRRATGGAIGASVHTVDHRVDTGDTFIRSLPVTVGRELSQYECHELIKPIEHTIYPMTLKMLGRGEVSVDNIPYTYDYLAGKLDDSGKPDNVTN